MTRVGLYTRYSTDKQREASIEDQARNCRRVAEREGWEIVEIYADQGISETRFDRPGYQRMLADAKAGKFQVLLAAPPRHGFSRPPDIVPGCIWRRTARPRRRSARYLRDKRPDHAAS